MLSQDIESLGDWIAENVLIEPLRTMLITQINGLTAQAHELERVTVPFGARTIAETANVTCLARRRQGGR